jgi:oxygen-independent coproporphyrinogen-3 oxidase
VAGIYIHIPFCRQACHYCNFHFSTSTRYKNDFVTALLKEIDLFPSINSGQAPSTSSGESIETIYFGGGTPSLCTRDELESILKKINATFCVEHDAEITLEANPDDITASALKDWKDIGINRLSIGVQSFFEDDLRWMNRAHNVSLAVNSLQSAVRYFDNITLDLIYGTPELTNEKWKYNVEKALSFNIPHLSCYALTVEPKTPLDKMIKQHKSPGINPDKQSEQFLLLMEWLEKAGYDHYEISNFAKPGFRSRHNSSYWQGKPYYGFGPSAHSFFDKTRWWNVANNTTYIKSITNGIIPLEKEVLTASQQINEYIMISLRTSEGLDLKKFTVLSSQFSVQPPIADDLLLKSKKYTDSGLMMIKSDKMQLTNEGKLLADGIAADLFIDKF